MADLADADIGHAHSGAMRRAVLFPMSGAGAAVARPFIDTLNQARDTLAAATEVDLVPAATGGRLTVVWRGAPVLGYPCHGSVYGSAARAHIRQGPGPVSRAAPPYAVTARTTIKIG